MSDIETIIENAFDTRAEGFEDKATVDAAVQQAIALLDSSMSTRLSSSMKMNLA